MIPLSIIRAVGNVRRRALPHYCADSELSSPDRPGGLSAGVTHRAWVAIEEARLPFAAKATTMAGMWRELTDRRSMTNLRAHIAVTILSGPP